MDPQRKLDDFKSYHNGQRVHSSLNGGDTPAEAAGGDVGAVIDLAHYRWEK